MLIGLAFAAAAAVGLWVAAMFGFVGRGDVARDVPPELAAVHAHFQRAGIDTRVGLIRREHTGIRVRAMFSTKEKTARVFYVVWCTSKQTANARASTLRASTIPGLVETNGALLLYLPGWALSDPLALTIFNAFKQYDASGIRPEGSEAR